MTTHPGRCYDICQSRTISGENNVSGRPHPAVSPGVYANMKVLVKNKFTRGGLAVLLALALLPLSGCKPAEAEIIITAMDTVMVLTAYGDAAGAALESARAEILRLEALLSATDPDSDIGRINADPTAKTPVDDSTMELLLEAVSLSEASGGAVDMTVYPLVGAYGFPSGEYILPSDTELAALLELVGCEMVVLDGEAGTVSLELDGMAIDLGAFAKGYASDRCAEIVSGLGVTSALLMLGGNVKAVGSKPEGSPWRVAVKDPLGGTGYVGVIEVSDLAVVTSGSYERYFDVETDGELRRIHHIIDPYTGRPAEGGLVSVTVVSADGLLADAYSTALFVMGLEEASEFWRVTRNFEAVFVAEDGEVYITEGLEGSYFPSDTYPEYALITTQ